MFAKPIQEKNLANFKKQKFTFLKYMELDDFNIKPHNHFLEIVITITYQILGTTAQAFEHFN
jgi:hypothetical protein